MKPSRTSLAAALAFAASAMATSLPNQDKLFPVETIEESFAKLHRVWESQQAADRLVTRLYDAPHEFNAVMQDDAFAWLDRQFGVEQ